MALQGNFTQDGMVCSAAYAFIDTVTVSKSGIDYHYNLHTKPPARDEDGYVIDRFKQLEHRTLRCVRVPDEDPFETSYNDLKCRTEFTNFTDV